MDDREILERRLVHTERRINELEQRVSQQRNVLAWIEGVGRGNSEIAEIARDLLRTMEMNVRRVTAERTQLRIWLGLS